MGHNQQPAAQDRGMTVLTVDATPDVVRAVEQAMATGRYTWQWDPEVDGVVGLVERGTNHAVVVVYADGDFEAEVDLTVASPVAWDRDETDPCERGTVGCSVRHGSADTACEGW